jgi:uncharacterized protein
MKAIQFFVLFICASHFSCKAQIKDTYPIDSFAHAIPKEPLGYVSDFATIFTPEQIVFLDSIITEQEKQTSHQIAVVTIKLDAVLIQSQSDFDRFSLALFKKWGVGHKGKDNGIGLLICPNLRKIRIEVGYGLEAKLTNEEAKNIIDTIIIPEFRKSDYYNGVLKGLMAIFKEIE